jgi:hypothetical protein
MVSSDTIVRIHRRFMTTALVAFWVAPMVFFLFIFWQSDQRLLSMACLVAMIPSVLAVALPEAWMRPRLWEKRGAVYRSLGVREFKRCLIGGDYINRQARRTNPSFRVFADEATLRRLDADTRAAEKGHALWLLVSLPAALFAAYTGWPTYAILLMLSNLVVNVYPILVQRDTRARIAVITHRRHARSQNTGIV